MADAVLGLVLGAEVHANSEGACRGRRSAKPKHLLGGRSSGKCLAVGVRRGSKILAFTKIRTSRGGGGGDSEVAGYAALAEIWRNY